MKINKVFLQKMKETLLSQKRELIIKSTRAVDIDTDGDETDEIQGNMLIELMNQLSTRDSSKLSQIEDALQRIEDSTYGLCQDCEDPIPNKRLLANPYFLTCVTCAEEREMEEKQRRVRN
jgi:DnaK suppressor protein